MPQQLLPQPREPRRVLVTGADGHLGALVLASLLRNTAAHVVTLVHPAPDRATVLAPVIDEWEHQSDGTWSGAVERRLSLLHWPQDLADLPDLAGALAGFDEIVQVPGSLGNGDSTRLRQSLLLTTVHLLSLARRLPGVRFVHLTRVRVVGPSTLPATDGAWPVPEPGSGLSPQVQLQRQAERLLATSGVPFLVLRPTMPIGERQVQVHVPAPEGQLPRLHMNAFCIAFTWARRWLPDGSSIDLALHSQDPKSIRRDQDVSIAAHPTRQAPASPSELEQLPLPRRARGRAKLAHVELDAFPAQA